VVHRLVTSSVNSRDSRVTSQSSTWSHSELGTESIHVARVVQNKKVEKPYKAAEALAVIYYASFDWEL